MHHHPRKRFGQHFLHDGSVIQGLIDEINPQSNDRLVEIGPGLGALTHALLPLAKKLIAIELDRDLIEPLERSSKQLGELIIYNSDVLSFDFSQLASDCSQLRVVGNLPYQISTPLLFHLIDQIQFIKDMHFMLQKEVVDRLAAEVGTKDYGRLSVMVQYHLNVEPLFFVSPEAFHPKPQVMSKIVRLYPRIPLLATKNYPLFAKIVKQAFNYRRKTLHNSLQGLIETAQLIELGIDPNLRPEQISVTDFVRMSNLLESN